MGVDIGVKIQTPQLKQAYLNMHEFFGNRNAFVYKNDDSPVYRAWKKIYAVIKKHPWFENNKDFTLNGERWNNLSLDPPDTIPFTDLRFNFAINQEVLFTNDIKRIVEGFDKIFLKLYSEDKYVKKFSAQLWYLVNNNLMLIPC